MHLKEEIRSVKTLKSLRFNNFKISVVFKSFIQGSGMRNFTVTTIYTCNLRLSKDDKKILVEFNTFIIGKRWYLPFSWSAKKLKGTVVNQSINWTGDSVIITAIFPLGPGSTSVIKAGNGAKCPRQEH